MNILTQKILEKIGNKAEFKKKGSFITEAKYSNGVKISFVLITLVPLIIFFSLVTFILKLASCSEVKIIDSANPFFCSILAFFSKPFEIVLPILEFLGR